MSPTGKHHQVRARRFAHAHPEQRKQSDCTTLHALAYAIRPQADIYVGHLEGLCCSVRNVRGVVGSRRGKVFGRTKCRRLLHAQYLLTMYSSKCFVCCRKGWGKSAFESKVLMWRSPLAARREGERFERALLRRGWEEAARSRRLLAMKEVVFLVSVERGNRPRRGGHA